MLISRFVEKLKNGNYDNSIAKLYPTKPIAERRARIIRLANDFWDSFGDLDAVLFSVPGRTELSGNHTDHNNGLALAGSVDIDIIAFAAKTGGNTIRIKSVGYRENTVDISSLSPDKFRKGSSVATIAGIADYFKKHNYGCGGFVAYSTSDIITGSGLSSSAAFEVICARILSEFYNDGKIPAIELAKAGEFAENVYFGKPCGLMDQAACASGGCIWIDIADNKSPITEKIDFDISKYGYNLCIVNTGGNHSVMTDDYADITNEMRSVAVLMGKRSLRFCDEDDFMRRIPYMRTLVGDRAIMRAMHFFGENRRVGLQKKALENNDFNTYLKLVSESGNSSFKLLQNAYTVKNVGEQGIPLALAITERFGAVCRVHGGGFAGTIQAYIPIEQVSEYKEKIESVFGENSCCVYTIRAYGAVVIEENEIKG